MRRSRYHDRAQLVLELERPRPQRPMVPNAKGLVQALADLLLEALAAETSNQGGEDEREDHV